MVYDVLRGVHVAFPGPYFTIPPQDIEMRKALDGVKLLNKERFKRDPQHPLARRAKSVLRAKMEDFAKSLQDGNSEDHRLRCKSTGNLGEQRNCENKHPSAVLRGGWRNEVVIPTQRR